MAGPMNNWQFQGYGQPAQNQGMGGPTNQPQPYPSTNFQPVQPPQVTIQQTPFVGRFIDNLDEVVPNEIPTDGRPGYFPTKNLEEIYFKVWKSDGQIKTLRYVLDPNFNPTPPPPQTEISMTSLLARIDDLEKKLADASTKNNGRQNSPKGGEK